MEKIHKSLNESMSDEVLSKSYLKLPVSHFLASLGCWEEPTSPLDMKAFKGFQIVRSKNSATSSEGVFD